MNKIEWSKVPSGENKMSNTHQIEWHDAWTMDMDDKTSKTKTQKLSSKYTQNPVGKSLHCVFISDTSSSPSSSFVCLFLGFIHF